MDADRFDGLTKTLGSADRRRVLGSLLGLLAAALPSIGAADPGPDCNDRNNRRKRGEACEKSCQCTGNLRCGLPRPTQDERDACGQDLDANDVCCVGQEDVCSADCDCCGRLLCKDGRCQPECPVGSEQCCSNRGRCLAGLCVADYATLAECHGRCNYPSQPFVQQNPCGDLVPCPDCLQCYGLTGCNSALLNVDGSTSMFCATDQGAGQDCLTTPCPTGLYCEVGGRLCMRICVDPPEAPADSPCAGKRKGKRHKKCRRHGR